VGVRNAVNPVVLGSWADRERATMPSWSGGRSRPMGWFAGGVVLAVMVSVILLACAPYAQAAPGSHAAGRAAARAGDETVTLQVDVLPTQAPDWVVFDYPATVGVHIPAKWAEKVAAYGAANMVLIAPLGWHERSATIGSDSSASVVLCSSAASPIQGSLTYYSDVAVMDGAQHAGQYFPWVRKHWSSLGYGYLPKPKPRAGLRAVTIGKRLCAYSVAQPISSSFRVSGVAHNGVMPGRASLPFDREEERLPASARALAAASLDFFVATYHAGP
jgi:hypothetical protein